MGSEMKDWTELMAQAEDLDKVREALSREVVIRQVMAESGESRAIVTDMVNAMRSMGEEAVLDLTEGEPTTLHAGLQRYVEELEGRDELQPRDRILDDLSTLLMYPWPGVPDAEALTREIHESYTRLAPARGFQVDPWDRLTSAEREMALAVVNDLLARDVIRKRPV